VALALNMLPWGAGLDAGLAAAGAGLLGRAPAGKVGMGIGFFLGLAWMCTSPRCWASMRWPTPADVRLPPGQPPRAVVLVLIQACTWRRCL
jgi:hypothetical protein